jgi:dienelactone hydrolase
VDADARLVLVHGATSGPWVFDEWSDHFADLDVRVPDLQAGSDVGHATMSDYADRVVTAAGDAAAVICGWSMGGLVAMVAAARLPLAALVVLEPSPPRELGRHDPTSVPTPGVYDAEDRYGPLPPGTRHRPESLHALGERERGISIPRIDCPFLVVAGATFGTSRGTEIADHYGADLLVFPDLDHTGLVRDAGVAIAIRAWLRDQPRP